MLYYFISLPFLVQMFNTQTIQTLIDSGAANIFTSNTNCVEILPVRSECRLSIHYHYQH